MNGRRRERGGKARGERREREEGREKVSEREEKSFETKAATLQQENLFDI